MYAIRSYYEIKLAPPNAPYFNNAHLLIAADCTAYRNNFV